MTKLRTVGVVAAFIAACGAGGFIAGATLDERCQTDTATKVAEPFAAARGAKAAEAAYNTYIIAAGVADKAYWAEQAAGDFATKYRGDEGAVWNDAIDVWNAAFTVYTAARDVAMIECFAAYTAYHAAAEAAGTTRAVYPAAAVAAAEAACDAFDAVCVCMRPSRH